MFLPILVKLLCPHFDQQLDFAPASGLFRLFAGGPILVMDVHEADLGRLGEKPSFPGGQNPTDLPREGKERAHKLCSGVILLPFPP